MNRRCIAFLLGSLVIAHAKDEAGKKNEDPAAKIPPIAATVDPSVKGLIPWPMRGEVGKTRVPVAPNARIVAATQELSPLADVLSQQILKLSGRQLPTAVGAPQAGDILLRIVPGLTFTDDPYLKLNPELKGYEQRITANAKGILIEGADYRATALATSTFVQSLDGMGPKLTFPTMKIEDKPSSTYTGLMLDVARQYHPVDILKDLVDMCWLYKVQYFQLHLTDDQGYRLPSKAYPQIPTAGASYTEDEIRDLVAYADARGVVIVPELEMPGHSGAIQGAMLEIFGAKNEATGKYDVLGMMNIANEEVYPVLEKLIAETCELFPNSPYFHIGADETNFGPFNSNPTVQKQLDELEKKKIIESKDQIFSHFLNKINAMVKKHGKKTMVWEGFGRDQKVDKDVIVMAWHGNSYPPQTLLENGYQVINVPWNPSVYTTARSNYEWNQWLLNLNEHGASQQFDMNPKVIGGAMVYWERAAHEALVTLRSKVPARQERLYSSFAGKTFEDFDKRYKHVDSVLERMLYPVEAQFAGLMNTEENLFVKPVKVKITSPIPGVKLRYTINEPKMTLENSTLYTAPFDITREQSPIVSIPGNTGARTELRIRAYGADDKPLGAVKMYTLRGEEPRVEYVIKEVPAGTDKIPADTRKLPVIATGKLSRLENSFELPSVETPRLFEATSRIGIEAAGDYRIFFSGKNGLGKNMRVKFGDGEWIDCPDGKEGILIPLKVGLQTMAVQHLAEDGRIGMALTCDQRPEDNRRFMDAYLSHFLVPLEAEK